MQVANGMVERRGSEDGGGSGPKVDGDVQGIAAADPGILAWHRDNDERQRKWAANLRGTPPGFVLGTFLNHSSSYYNALVYVPLGFSRLMNQRSNFFLGLLLSLGGFCWLYSFLHVIRHFILRAFNQLYEANGHQVPDFLWTMAKKITSVFTGQWWVTVYHLTALGSM